MGAELAILRRIHPASSSGGHGKNRIAVAEGEVVRFERGVNVLELTPFTGEQQGVLKTIFLPYLRHSQLARVVDNEFWGTR